MSLIGTILFWLLVPLIFIGCIILIVLILYCTCKCLMDNQKERRQASSAYSSQAGTTIRDIVTQSQQQASYASANANASRQTMLFAITSLLIALAAAQTTTQTVSYKSCSDGSSNTALECSANGLYTYMEFSYTRPRNSTHLFYEPVTWRVVASNLTANNQLSSLNQCAGATTCTKIQDNIIMTVKSLGIHTGQRLLPTDFISPYGYYFDTFNASYDYRLLFVDDFDESLPACTGFPTKFNTHYTNPLRPASGLDFRAAAMADPDLCGTAPDLDMIAASPVLFHANRFGAAHGGMCTPCPASGIVNSTVARTLPFGRCDIMSLATNPDIMVEVDVNFTSSAYSVPERLLLSTLDRNSGLHRSSRSYARGMLTSASNTNPTANLVSGIATSGYIAMCGVPTEGSARPVAKTEEHLLTGVGAVPTANFFGHNFMWYYISHAEFNNHYGAACGKVGGLGGIDQELYGSGVRMTNACADTDASENALSGPCVPGVASGGAPTPCQVASELNEFSAAWIAWRNGGSVGPMPAIPPHLPPRYNPDAPNFHLSARGGSYFLTFEDTTEDSTSDIEFVLRLDVSEDFARYADAQNSVIVDNNNNTQCQYYHEADEGAILVQVCNLGETPETFQVKLLECEDTISDFVFEAGTLPLSQNITNLSSTLHSNCATISPWFFSLNDTSKLAERTNTSILANYLSYPAFIGSCHIQILDSEGQILLGKKATPDTLNCIALETPTQFINHTVLYMDESGHGFWCMLTFQCPEEAIMFYGTLVGLFILVILLIVGICCCCQTSQKNKDSAAKQTGVEPSTSASQKLL